jgi:hypothetical protein
MDFTRSIFFTYQSTHFLGTVARFNTNPAHVRDSIIIPVNGYNEQLYLQGKGIIICLKKSQLVTKPSKLLVKHCYFRAKYYYVNQIKSYETDGACSTHEGGEKCLQNFGWKNLRKETTRKN